MPTMFRPARSRRADATGLFTDQEYARQRAFFTTRVSPTPLVSLPGLATRLGLGALWVKNETRRFDLPAFKSLGVEFALHEMTARGALDGVDTLVCASAGNHGRAVARAARHARLHARVFLDRDVASSRVAAIRSENAEVVRVEGTYDDAVRLAADDAARTGALIVSDTSWLGYEQVPRDIMLGYTRVMDEAAAAWAGQGPPDLMVVQAGVGGLLAAVASWSARHLGPDRPALIAVEPWLAACVQASARAGAPAAIGGPLTTIMAGLRCGEVSPLAFDVVPDLVDGYIAVEDDWCRAAMHLFAHPEPGDPDLAVGTSGAAGLAALLAATESPAAREFLAACAPRVAPRVLIIATEGITEPDLWADVTGRTPSA
jgi:diaminopropionate ammonia-lyase